MSFYITSSRKPSVTSRQLCKWFERIFLAEYENRGKRSIEEVVARAEEKGFKRVLFVYENHGSPSELSFLQGDWLEPVIPIKLVVFHDSKKRVRGRPAIVVEKGGEAFAELFNCVYEDTGMKCFLSREKIWFEQDGERVGPELVLKESN